MAVTLRYFTAFDTPVYQHNHADPRRNLCTSLLYFVVRVRCRRKESSRSLSHLLMSFLYWTCAKISNCSNIKTLFLLQIKYWTFWYMDYSALIKSNTLENAYNDRNMWTVNKGWIVILVSKDLSNCCKEYFTVTKCKTSVLLQIKYWTVSYMDHFSASSYTRVTNCRKRVGFVMA